jgi:K+-sensing histidine kinase KdpD
MDNGGGIPQGEWESIFDPYSRSHHRAGQPASVGLGLTVSRVLARRMGGDLTYRYDGRTSVFEMVLPTSAASVGLRGNADVGGDSVVAR